MTTIPERQNEPRSLDLLAAYRHLWSAAKMQLGVALAMSVPAAAGWAVVGGAWPKLKAYGALWGMTVLVVNVVLDRRRKQLSRKAAAVQELFDCHVLELDWNPVLAGSRPIPEDIADATQAYKNHHRDLLPLIDWYPKSVASLPLPLARIICQRANCTWESGLRRKYSGAILTILLALIALVSVSGLVNGLELGAFLIAVLPALPAVSLGVTQFYEHRDAGETSERLARHADDIFARAVKGDLAGVELANASRRLQDAILERRRAAPPIFDWVYRRLRTKHDAQMNKAAAELVEEALATTKGGPS